MGSEDYINDIAEDVLCRHIRRSVFGAAVVCDDCGHVTTPEPTSPSVDTTDWYKVAAENYDLLGVAEGQSRRHEADAKRLAKENRELKEEILRLKQVKFVGGIHGS